MLDMSSATVLRCACITVVNKSGRESASTSIRRACASLVAKLSISDIRVAGGSCLFGISDLKAVTMVRGAVVLGASAALAAGIVLARCAAEHSGAQRAAHLRSAPMPMHTCILCLFAYTLECVSPSGSV